MYVDNKSETACVCMYVHMHENMHARILVHVCLHRCTCESLYYKSM